MAVPFRRKSSKKTRQGRSAENLRFKKKAFLKLIKCKNCNEYKVMHHVCNACFTYKNLTFK